MPNQQDNNNELQQLKQDTQNSIANISKGLYKGDFKDSKSSSV